MTDNFGDRMKEYENAYRIKLPRRLPVIIRIDGKAFHTFTRDCEKPFDEDLTLAFWATCKHLAKEIMGTKVVYHQSDEISLLLTNYDKLTTEAWFDNNIQKIVSVAASEATAAFNDAYSEIKGKKMPSAKFDARVYVLPHDEVTNYFLWRQQDASKNSISMVAQANFPHKELQGLNGKQMQEKLFQEKGINWNDLPVWQKRGVCVVKEEVPHVVHVEGRNEPVETMRTRWAVDHNTPRLSENREYIDKFVYLEGRDSK